MAYPAAIARLKVHATTAGAGLSNPITDVAIAYPAPRSRCIRLFYGGETEAEHIGADDTLISVLTGDQTVVMGFWPLSNLSETQAAVVEAEVQAFVHAFRTAVLGDVGLATAVHALEVEFAEPGFADLAGTPFRTVEIRVNTEFTEYTVTR